MEEGENIDWSDEEVDEVWKEQNVEQVISDSEDELEEREKILKHELLMSTVNL